MPAKAKRAWRVRWTHVRSGDVFLGGAWDRETAEYMRDEVVAPNACCVDVHLVAAGPLTREERAALFGVASPSNKETT